MLKSEWRFFHALFFYFGPPSHILYNIKWPFLAINLISLLIQHLSAFTDILAEFKAELSHLRTAFTMTSFCMSLLLSYRVNRAYERWNQARSSISGLGGGAVNLYLLIAVWFRDSLDQEKIDLLHDLKRFCIVWPYSILQVLRGHKALPPSAATYLCEEELAVYSGSRKGRQVIATAIRCIVDDLQLPDAKLIACDSLIQSSLTSGGQALRIRFAALPQALSLVSSGFILLWCSLLPFGLLSDQFMGDVDQGALIAVAVISLLLLSVDEVASQLEDPFPFLPLEDICETYERDILRISNEMTEIRQAMKAGRQRRIGVPGSNVQDHCVLTADLLHLETGGSS